MCMPWSYTLSVGPPKRCLICAKMNILYPRRKGDFEDQIGKRPRNISTAHKTATGESRPPGDPCELDGDARWKL